MNCDSIAPYYAAIEFTVFGRTLERCRFHFLPELSGSRRALILGEGDGRFLKRLLSTCPALRADYIDCSPGMLERARRYAGSDNATYHCTDVLSGSLPSADYDLVVSHFFLDCFDPGQLTTVVERVAMAAPRARWLISEFRVPENRWLAGPARTFIATMYWFFRVAAGLKTRSLVDHRPLLSKAGFHLSATASHAHGFMVSEMWVPEPLK